MVIPLSSPAARAGCTFEPVVWLDGAVRPAAAATVSVFDHGLLVGDGVFETCKVDAGVAFAWDRHVARLHRSAAQLRLPCPDAAQLDEALDAALAAAADRAGGPVDGRVRVTVTSGAGPLGSGRGDSGPTLVLVVAPCSPWPGRIAVVTVPWPRNERSPLVGAKTVSYAENVLAVQVAHDAGASEALMPNLAGVLCEGTGSNVAVAVGEQLVTPPLTSGCLAGITRELLLEWAAEDGLPVVEGTVTMEDLAVAQDVVLLSSTRDVQRVHVLDGRELAGGALGDAAAALFARRSVR